jgi:ACS family pantothenate transporter-like MFS transporter
MACLLHYNQRMVLALRNGLANAPLQHCPTNWRHAIGCSPRCLSTNLDGSLGKAGWRWSFVIIGVCTIFVALLVFFALLGFPERHNQLSKWYLKSRHMEIALARSRRVGRKPQAEITIRCFFRAFTFGQLWAFMIAWAITGNTTPSSYFNLWLKSLKKANEKLK